MAYLVLLMVYAIALLNPAMFGVNTVSGDLPSVGSVNSIPKTLVNTAGVSEEIPSSIIETDSLISGAVTNSVPTVISNSTTNATASSSGKVQATNQLDKNLAALVEQELSRPIDTSNIEDLKKFREMDIEKINLELEKLEQSANKFGDPEKTILDEAESAVVETNNINNTQTNITNTQKVIDSLKQQNTANLTFKFGELTLSDQALVLVRSVSNVLKEHKDIKLDITNYTDSYGDDNYNLGLSKKRAKVVYNAFIVEGVEKSQLSYQGLGEASPLVSNSTLAGRRKNRRTELSYSKVN